MKQHDKFMVNFCITIFFGLFKLPMYINNSFQERRWSVPRRGRGTSRRRPETFEQFQSGTGRSGISDYSVPARLPHRQSESIRGRISTLDDGQQQSATSVSHEI